MKLLTLLFLLIPFVSQPQPTDVTLTVQVEGIKSPDGIIKVCLFNSEETYLEDAEICIRSKASLENPFIVNFNNLQSGNYAAVVYHDSNGNDKLDTNFMKIPVEAYGFSNNPKSLFGPPKYSKAVFYMPEDTTIVIRL